MLAGQRTDQLQLQMTVCVVHTDHFWPGAMNLRKLLDYINQAGIAKAAEINTTPLAVDVHS